MKHILSFLVIACALTGVTSANADDFVTRYPEMTTVDCSFTPGKHDKCTQLTQIDQSQRTVTLPAFTAPAPSTIIDGGSILSEFIKWFALAFGTAIASMLTALLVRVFTYLGIQTTQLMRDQLQSIVVNGINDAAAKVEVALKNNPRLDFDVKSKIVADAVKYTQDHAPATIKALGLDPQSGEAVKVITARIETALNDPKTPTPASITPATGS